MLSGFISFLLAIHCLMYKRINKKWSWRILKRNRVQILALSLVMNVILFIKLTFNFDLLSLVIIVVGQLLRFNIWSLALMNFMKSVASLIKSRRVKFIIKCLNLYVVIATCGFVGYSISLIVIEQATSHEILSCKSYEFIT